MAFKLTVSGFAEGASIPSRFTCDGHDVSPALQWTDAPSNTKSFALIMDDPDAPAGTWNHWLVWDIPASVRSLPEASEQAVVGKVGTNDFGRQGYGGPCPPRGKGVHGYVFRLFALDVPFLELPSRAERRALEKAVRKHAVAESTYMGRYGRG